MMGANKASCRVINVQDGNQFCTVFYKDDKVLLLCKEILVYVILLFAQMTFNVSEASKLR